VYQSIDDPQDELDALERGDKRLFIWLVAALCLALIFAIVYWTSSGSPTTTAQNDNLRAEQATYRKAISEIAAVINAHETRTWTEVTDIIFAPKTPREDKIVTLDNFEAEWGGALLGGRDAEIRDLRKEILQTDDDPKTPSRKLTDLKSPIPKTVPDTMLAGGPRPVTPPPTIVRPIPPAPAPERVVELDVVQPKVRRNVTPRYPRKAMRRKVKAIVTLKLNIDEKGKVAMTELVDVQASRYEKSFIKAAERAAMRTRFHPKTVGGVPQAAIGVVKRYRFEP